MFWFILLLIGCTYLFINALRAKKNEYEETNNQILLARSVLPKLKEYRLDLKADINEVRKLLNSADRDNYKFYLSNKEELEEREILISVLIEKVGELANFKTLSSGITDKESWNTFARAAYHEIYFKTSIYLEDIEKLLNS